MKKTLIITFEVPDGSDLTQFHQVLKDYGVWARITEHTWAIVTEDKTSEVRDKLIALLPSTSRLMVLKSANIASWRNVICSSEWLKKNL